MKKLTILPKIKNSEFQFLIDQIDINLSDNFKSFMQIYSGCSVKERNYIFEGETWELSHFSSFKLMYELSKECVEQGHGKKVPFAFDSGGWPYRISFDDSDYLSVYVDRISDGFHPRFIKIADSFEEFIDGLQPESEVS